MEQSMDLIIIRPGAQKTLYQDLSKSLSGLEPPLWAALLAAFIREKGFKVILVDAEMEPEKVVPIVSRFRPRLTAVVVSGTNPSASTMNMIGARTVLTEIKKIKSDLPSILIGLHPSALPERTLTEEPVDMVCEGEGFYTLLDLLSGLEQKKVRGLWYRQGRQAVSNPKADLVDPDQLPMAAWDLLPMNRYRAHNWHCFDDLEHRSPYGIIYTSLGCPFGCTFCCINAIFGKHTIRYRKPGLVIKEIGYLVENYGIKNIKIIDEMFDLNQKHVLEICDLIIERKYDLNIWAYARVDTINEMKLERMKKAGINWLAVGFESANQNVRDVVAKGRFDNKRISEVVRMMKHADINICGNFIFGLPGDTMESMRETLDTAKEFNCEYANLYAAMAYPGSQLFKDTPPEFLPEAWDGYSQFGVNARPLPTGTLTPEDVLRFRDNAFHEYFESKAYLDMIEEKFGKEVKEYIQEMAKVKLKRRILEEIKA